MIRIGLLISWVFVRTFSCEAQRMFMDANDADGLLVFTHRGYWEGPDVSENTWKSIKAGLDAGFSGVELDLWTGYTGPGMATQEVVLFHDVGLGKRFNLLKQFTEVDFTEIVTESQTNGINNGFYEKVIDEEVTVLTLAQTLDKIVEYYGGDPQNVDVWLNLDRSCNEMSRFKATYKIVEEKGLLHKTIFKGHYWNDEPFTGDYTINNVDRFRDALQELYANESISDINERLNEMMYTPVLFDNEYREGAHPITNDATMAQEWKLFIDEMISSGLAAGFEFNTKAYPAGSEKWSTGLDKNIIILKEWGDILGYNADGTGKNFIQYVRDQGYPVGNFASVPEVCAVAYWNQDNSRDNSLLVSGFVKEDYNHAFVPKINDITYYDFRGDFDFLISTGIDYVIIDRSDAMISYLEALDKNMPNAGN